MNQLKIYWDKSFTDWRYRLILHLCFWLFFLSSWLDETMVVSIKINQHILVTLVGTAFVLYLYYTLVYLIWPFFKKKEWLIGILLFILYYVIGVILRSYHIDLIIQWYNLHDTNIAGGLFFKNLYARQFQPMALTQIIFSGLSSLILIVYIPLTIKFLRYAYQFSQQQAWMLKENAQLQLNTLKAQLNPHFFFNTLNNLQSFIVQNENEKSVDLLNKLADFMRTSLYDGNQELITMQKEIELLNNYVAIERVRFEDDVNIRLELSNKFSAYQIPPFLFLPFVENAFKYGGTLAADQVKIEIILINEKDKIILKTSNSFKPLPQQKTTQGGIGLQNVKKRLAYYFTNGYQLDINSTDTTFNVYLELTK